MDWQPIETAPKDGTVLLLLGEFHDGSKPEPFIGWYSEEDSVQADMPYGPFVWKQHEASSVARDVVTRWMPLPETN